MCQKGLQFAPGPVQVRLHRSQGKVHNVGDFLVGITFHVPEKNGGAVLGAEPPDGLLDLASQLLGLHVTVWCLPM